MRGEDPRPGDPGREVTEGVPGSPGKDGEAWGERSLLGEKVGSIRITELIARGGMGEVYAAYDEKLQRKVAIKTLKGALLREPEARARFLQEARVLSQLEHPHICRIYDLLEGEREDMLVLELVRGKVLQERIRQGLTKGEKFRIAEEIAGVLAAAHGKGIVHRDMKPQNVMVTEEGGTKVLDFGLSRLLVDPSAPTIGLALETGDAAGAHAVEAGGGVHTRVGAVLGTLGYMSPEQANGRPATPASDMYSFGLLLQELFTGRPPYEPGLGPPASLKRAKKGETLPVIGLDKDLTLLIGRLKSLEPSARPSAIDVAEKLAWIRTGPQRRRNRLLAVAAIVLLAVFSAAMTVQSIRATRAERAAQQEAETSKQIADFLVGLFKISSPGESHGNKVTARELLDQGAAKIDRELKDQPVVQARLMDTMGVVYYKLGLYAQAQPLLENALAARERTLGPDAPDVGRSLGHLSSLYRQEGRTVEARSASLRSVNILEKTLGPNHPDVAASLINLGNVYVNQGMFAEAEPIYQRCLRIREMALGRDSPVTASTLMNLAVLYEEQGKYAEAEPLYQRCVAIYERCMGPDHPDVADSVDNLASLYFEEGRYAEAAPLYERSLEIREKALGRDHPDVAGSLDNLASLFTQWGRYADAEPLYKRSLAIREKALGPNHPDVANVLNNLANLYAEEARCAEAEPLYRRSLEIREKNFGPEHPKVAHSLLNLALLYRDLGRYTDAEPLFRRSLRIGEDALGPEHPYVAESLNSLGLLYLLEGKYSEAEPLFQKSLAIREKVMGPQSPDVALSLYGLARLKARQGKRDEALDLLQRALPQGKGQPWMWSIGEEPHFASLRGDSKFQRIVAEVGQGAQGKAAIQPK